MHADRGVALARAEQRGLVDDVLELGAREAGAAARDLGRVDVRRARAASRGTATGSAARPSASGASTVTWRSKRPGTQQRRVENVRAVGRGEDDQAAARVEAVHLHQQLVERLLALVVALPDARAALAADGVELVDEDDRGRRGARLGEQVADAGRADADERLDELRAGDREERGVGLAGGRAREQRLARAGRPDEQRALRRAGAERAVAVGVAQQIAQLLELGDGGGRTRDVGERRAPRAGRGRAWSACRAQRLNAPIPLASDCWLMRMNRANREARIRIGSSTCTIRRLACLPLCASITTSAPFAVERGEQLVLERPVGRVARPDVLARAVEIEDAIVVVQLAGAADVARRGHPLDRRVRHLGPPAVRLRGAEHHEEHDEQDHRQAGEEHGQGVEGDSGQAHRVGPVAPGGATLSALAL